MGGADAAALEGRAEGPHGQWNALAFRWSAAALVAAAWISAGIFGVYILAFYAGTAFGGSAELWNEVLPGLHDAAAPLATAAIAMHFVAGGILLLLGPVQLLAAVRQRMPRLHRSTGRLYVLAGMIAGLGGLAFIAFKGTVGGPVMSTGFALYGGLVVLAAVKTYAHARARRFEVHRAWAIRLFALAVGSWLYRMEYAFWFLTVDGVGHAEDFSGWFDAVMAFFFYLPNLAVAELFIRRRQQPLRRTEAVPAVLVMLGATAFVTAATWFFTAQVWWPGMVAGLTP